MANIRTVTLSWNSATGPVRALTSLPAYLKRGEPVRLIVETALLADADDLRLTLKADGVFDGTPLLRLTGWTWDADDLRWILDVTISSAEIDTLLGKNSDPADDVKTAPVTLDIQALDNAAAILAQSDSLDLTLKNDVGREDDDSPASSVTPDDQWVAHGHPQTLTGIEKAQARTNIDAEAALGNPASDGYVLSSTALGVRSWIAQSGGGGGGTITINSTFTSGFTAGSILISDGTKVQAIVMVDANMPAALASQMNGPSGLLQLDSNGDLGFDGNIIGISMIFSGGSVIFDAGGTAVSIDPSNRYLRGNDGSNSIIVDFSAQSTNTSGAAYWFDPANGFRINGAGDALTGVLHPDGDPTQVVLGDNSFKPLSEFAEASDLAAYLPLAGGTMDNGAAIAFANGTSIRANPTGTGMDLICTAELVNRWREGRQWFIASDGTTVQRVISSFDETPGVSFDNTMGFVVGSTFESRDGTAYVCSSAATGAAVWGLVSSAGTPSGPVWTYAIPDDYAAGKFTTDSTDIASITTVTFSGTDKNGGTAWGALLDYFGGNGFFPMNLQINGPSGSTVFPVVKFDSSTFYVAGASSGITTGTLNPGDDYTWTLLPVTNALTVATYGGADFIPSDATSAGTTTFDLTNMGSGVRSALFDTLALPSRIWLTGAGGTAIFDVTAWSSPTLTVTYVTGNLTWRGTYGLRIVPNAPSPLLPTTDEKAAMTSAATAPNAENPFVTAFDAGRTLFSIGTGLSGNITPDLANGFNQTFDITGDVQIQVPAGTPIPFVTKLTLVLNYSDGAANMLDFAAGINNPTLGGYTFPMLLADETLYIIELSYGNSGVWFLDFVRGGYPAIA